MKDAQGQLTARGIAIGVVGCAVITASSLYIALRMGALPWPIVFAAIVSLFFLKAVSRGRSTLNEANVTHTIMSAGAMVAGGLAFTIPGAWMLGLADEVSLGQLLAIALGGVALGIAATALLRRHFIEGAALEYPIGQAAAETLKAGDSPERTGRKLFGAMSFAGLYALLRDGLGVLPTLLISPENTEAAAREWPSASTTPPCPWPWASWWAPARCACGSPGRCWAASASSWAARRRAGGTWPRPRAS